MASASMAIPLMSATQNRLNQSNSASLFKSVPVRPSKKAAAYVKPKSKGMLKVEAFFKEQAVAGLTTAALTATMVIPEMAEAAGSGLTPSLNNFLLSIAAGGVVHTVLIGAVVVGVSNFDSVKRT